MLQHREFPIGVDRIWGLWGSYYNIPKAIFYLLKEDYTTCHAVLHVCPPYPNVHWVFEKSHELRTLNPKCGLGFQGFWSLIKVMASKLHLEA